MPDRMVNLISDDWIETRIIATFLTRGLPMIIVHDGNPRIDSRTRSIGLKDRRLSGRRYSFNQPKAGRLILRRLKMIRSQP